MLWNMAIHDVGESGQDILVDIWPCHLVAPAWMMLFALHLGWGGGVPMRVVGACGGC